MCGVRPASEVPSGCPPFRLALYPISDRGQCCMQGRNIVLSKIVGNFFSCYETTRDATAVLSPEQALCTGRTSALRSERARPCLSSVTRSFDYSDLIGHKQKSGVAYLQTIMLGDRPLYACWLIIHMLSSDSTPLRSLVNGQRIHALRLTTRVYGFNHGNVE